MRIKYPSNLISQPKILLYCFIVGFFIWLFNELNNRSNATILYHLDNYRDVKHESGLPFNDKDLKIKWKTKKPILSLRDKNHFSFKEFKEKVKTL